MFRSRPSPGCYQVERSRTSCVSPEQLALLGAGIGAHLRHSCVRIAAVERAAGPHRMHDHGELARDSDRRLAVRDGLGQRQPHVLTLSFFL